MRKVMLVNAMVLALGTMGAIQGASAEVTASANAALTTDYKFRGISQTNSGPAFQGGFDVGLGNGFYVGNWNSNVSFTGATGSGLEMDFYGGYAGEYAGVGYDIGALYYLYEGATIAPGAADLDTLEVYGKLSYKGFYGKLSYGASKDYFGLTAANGSLDQAGSLYTDLGYSYPLTDALSLNLHYGVTSYDKSINRLVGPGTEKSYDDYSIGAAYTHGKFTYTAAVVGTNQKAENLFGKDATEDSLILTIGTKF